MTSPHKEIRQIGTKNGIWQVERSADGQLQILDQHGRQRHYSANHLMTGVFLAMALAEREPQLELLPNADEALRLQAAQFPL